MDDYTDRHNNTREERPQRLGFKEIVPGRDDVDAHETDESLPGEIPEYDLGRHMMAEHRKTVATRRKGPSKQPQTSASLNPPPISYSVKSPRNWAISTTKEQMDIIAEIVTRDIERLCRGEPVFII